MTMTVDEQQISALVDGELPGDEAAAIEAAAVGDPALAARIERARTLRAAVAAAFSGTLSEAPPDRLVAAIQGPATVVDLNAARARHLARAPTVMRWGAMAASLAAAFVLGRFALAPTTAPIAATPQGLAAAGVLADGLQRQLASNQGPDASVKIGVSFQAADGRYCRTFVLRQQAPVAGLACREAAGWRVAMALAAPPASAASYRTAAAETPTPILEAVDRMIRGDPLDAAGEARARASGWRAGGR